MCPMCLIPHSQKKKLLSRILKGSSAVPIGEPFEEPLLVPGRTLLDPSRTNLGSMYDPQWKGFYMEPKMVLPGTKKGSPMRTVEEAFWNPFF